MVRCATLMVSIVLASGPVFSQQHSGSSLLLDDFTRPDGRSELSTEWEGFTDRVMGGRSDITVRVEDTNQGPALRMTGRVSLENRGGFIQARLPMAREGSMDAGEYRGVALTARAAGDHLDRYYVHLRTNRTRFPWSHYAQNMTVGEDWRRIELSFEDFEPRYMLGGGSPNVSNLRSVAIVAGNAEFTADIQVSSIELYK